MLTEASFEINIQIRILQIIFRVLDFSRHEATSPLGQYAFPCDPSRHLTDMARNYKYGIKA